MWIFFSNPPQLSVLNGKLFVTQTLIQTLLQTEHIVFYYFLKLFDLFFFFFIHFSCFAVVSGFTINVITRYFIY